MTKPLLALMVLTVLSHWARADDEAPIDPKLAGRSSVVIRGQRLRTVPGALHPSDDVQVLAVLKNESKRDLGKTMRIGRGEFSPAIPKKPCTVYLKQAKKPGSWFLVGVSHATNAKQEKPGPAAAADWQSLFEKERWYLSQRGKETVFRGRLEGVPKAGGASTLQRTSYYRLGDRTIYTGANRVAALERLVGKTVEVRGKAVDFKLEGQQVREIWPAAVRVAIREANAAGEVPDVKEVIGVTPLSKSRFLGFRGTKPVIIKTNEQLTKLFGKEATGKVGQQVDLGKQYLILFGWSGSGQDMLAGRVTTKNAKSKVVFTYKPGRTRDLRPHAKLFAVGNGIEWEIAE